MPKALGQCAQHRVQHGSIHFQDIFKASFFILLSRRIQILHLYLLPTFVTVHILTYLAQIFHLKLNNKYYNGRLKKQ